MIEIKIPDNLLVEFRGGFLDGKCWMKPSDNNDEAMNAKHAYVLFCSTSLIGEKMEVKSTCKVEFNDPSIARQMGELGFTESEILKKMPYKHVYELKCVEKSVDYMRLVFQFEYVV